jgi:hypothetical protein
LRLLFLKSRVATPAAGARFRLMTGDWRRMIYGSGRQIKGAAGIFEQQPSQNTLTAL